MDMRRRGARLGVVALLLAGPGLGLGCRPPLRRLTEHGQYEQALCAAAQVSPDPERDLAYVGRRLDADARPRLHLYAVPRAELEGALGEAGRSLADRAVLVRAVVAIDDVQVDDFGVRMALVGAEGPLSSQPPSVQVLASLVGETIPADVVAYREGGRELVPERFGERPLMGMTAAVLEASTLFLLPVTVFTGHSRVRSGRTTRTPPTEAEVLAAAPVASTVAGEAARLGYTAYDQGQEVSSVWLWPRAQGELKLVVEWSYAAYGCAGRKPAFRQASLGRGEVVRTVTIVLPPGAELESRIAAVFGDRMRPLAP